MYNMRYINFQYVAQTLIHTQLHHELLLLYKLNVVGYHHTMLPTITRGIQSKVKHFLVIHHFRDRWVREYFHCLHVSNRYSGCSFFLSFFLALVYICLLLCNAIPCTTAIHTDGRRGIRISRLGRIRRIILQKQEMIKIKIIK